MNPIENEAVQVAEMDLKQPMDAFLASAESKAQRLEAELDDKEHPFERCDRWGTKRRAATELAEKLFLVQAKLRDQRAQIKRWQEGIEKARLTESVLLRLVDRMMAIQARYHELA